MATVIYCFIGHKSCVDTYDHKRDSIISKLVNYGASIGALSIANRIKPSFLNNRHRTNITVKNIGYQLKAGYALGLTVRPELVEG